MSGSAKISIASEPAMRRRTFPCSTASPSICSNKTKAQNAASMGKGSKLDGIMITCYICSEIKMRLPWGIGPLTCVVPASRDRFKAPMSAPNSRFIRACRCEPVDVTPIWLMRQAGRYMAEYRAVRKNHSILEICKTPEIAADVTITAAEKLDVDAAIIFADLLLPLEVMGMPFRFEAGEGPVIERPLRAPKDIASLVTNRAAELGY